MKVQIPNTLTGSSPNNLLVPYHPEYALLTKNSTSQNNLKDQIMVALKIVLKYFEFLSEIKEVGLQYSIVIDGKDPVQKDSLANKISGSSIKNLTYYFIMFIHLVPEEA